MDKIIIIGANEFQDPLIKKAKSLGYETHVFAWEEGAIGKKHADYFYPISIVEKEEILEIGKKIQPVAVLTIASDLAAVTAAFVAKGLGLPCNSAACIEKTTNKFTMRQAMKEGGVLVPGFAVVNVDNWEESIKDLHFPMVVKPTDRSGSRSITEVRKKEELQEAVSRATCDSFEKRGIVEEYIEGQEYSMESISYKGMHHLLAITKKFTTGAPHYIETGHVQPAQLSVELREKIQREIFKALDALEITTGASHAEFRVNEQKEVRIIEIGARMGGDCIGSHLVELSEGYDFLKMVIDVARGVAPDLRKTRVTPQVSCIQFILTEEDWNRYEKIKKEYPSSIVEESDIGKRNHDVIDSSSRFGYYIIECQSYEILEEMMK